jgi:hypothetical protein
MKNTKNKMVPIHPTGQACGFSRHDSYKDHTFKIVNNYESEGIHISYSKYGDR